MQKIALYAFVFGMFFVATPALAQDETTATTHPVATTESVEVTQDETVTASDLGVAEPTLLPDSKFYFFKNWARGIREALTFNKVKKANLAVRFASERLLEAQKLVDKTSDASILNKAIENYQQEVEKIKSLSDQINKNDPNTGKFLDKLTDVQLKHQRLMDRLSKQLPEQAKEKVLQAQEKSLERFGEVMMKLDDPEKMKERLEKAIEAQKGGEFKNFKNLEVLMRIEANAPEQAKEALQRAQENVLNRLHGDLSQMSPEDQAKFKDYLSSIGGNELRHAEIIDRLENKGLPEGIKPGIEKLRANITEILGKRMESMSEEDKTKYFEQMQKGELPRPRIMNELERRMLPTDAATQLRQIQQPPFRENARPPLPGQINPAIRPLLPGQIAPTPTPSGCNQVCNYTVHPARTCQMGLVCVTKSQLLGASGLCRNQDCPNETSCQCSTPTPTPALSQ